MLLNRLLNSNPKDMFTYLERRINNENFKVDVLEKYKPSGSAKNFKLPFVVFAKKRLTCFDIDPDPRLIDLLQVGNNVKFFIHPEMIRDYKDKNIVELLDICDYISVSPTSSTRTIIALENDYPFMIKTDLERKIGDGIKKLKEDHLNHIKRVGMEFLSISLTSFGYLPESFGAIFSFNNQEVGLVAREFYAKPRISNNKTYLLPFFSLFSQDRFAKKDPLLILQILQNLNNKKKYSNLDTCLEEIIEPYLSVWANLILQRGLSAEMHAQNTLLEIDNYGIPIRIIYRDLQDTFIDLDIRKNKDMSCDFNRNIIGQNERIYKINGIPVTNYKKCKQISYSLTYDYRIGKALDYFITALNSAFPSSESYLILAIKKIWGKYFKKTDVFPSKAYYLQKNQNDISKELNFIETEPKYR